MKLRPKLYFPFLVILIFVVVILVACTTSGSTYGQLKTLDELAKHPPSQSAAITIGVVPYAIDITYYGKVYVANRGDGTVSVISALNNTKIGKDIKVGEGPDAIGVDQSQHKVYVANYEDGTVSVISALNDTKIGKDIKVGGNPSAIGIDEILHKVYVANSGNDTVSVINSTSDNKIGKDIKVGGHPSAIGIWGSTAYVANSGTDNVSVIDLRYDTKIGKDIKVGEGPSAIGVDDFLDKVYVANSDNDTVSVIDPFKNKKIGNDIKVGKGPSGIGVDNNLNPPKVYVANTIDGTVSVINSKNDTKIGKDIKVGKGPIGIGVFSNLLTTHILYVANSFDNTVSVIDETTKKVVAAVTFSVKPFNAGHIECGKDRLIAPVAQQFYIGSGSECTARPNQGFDFVSWQENLGGNSSRVLQFASPPPFYEPILDALHLAPDKPEATLNITKFGSFTANLKALPPPIPPEYVATLFTVVITAFVGTWLTPTVIGWRKARKEGSRLNDYRNEITMLYNDGKLDENDIEKLNKLKADMTHTFSNGKINEQQYTNLKNEISILYYEIYRKKIESLNSKNSDKISDDISDAYAKGKIIEQHFKLLIEKISNRLSSSQARASQGSPIKS